MFTDEFLERIFANEEMQKIPIGCQSTAVHAFQEVLEDIKEEILMQTYPQYYPQMNNYGQQYNPQQPYMDRLAGLQQYQQTLQQPQMAGTQMSLPNQPIGLNGKMVDTVEQITANDVPMDGSVAIFPKRICQRFI